MIRDVTSLPAASKMKPFVTVTVVGIPVAASASAADVEATKSSFTTPVSAAAVATVTAFDQSILSRFEFANPVAVAFENTVAGIRVAVPPRIVYVLYR